MSKARTTPPARRPRRAPILALITVCAGASCVSSRPARNGVFNENQYLRKDFLIRGGSDPKADPGWFMQVTVTSASTPNPLASVDGAGLFAGAQAMGPNFVRFAVTEDKLELLDMRELSDSSTLTAQGLRIPAAMNAWSATNVDLKYRVNLDGEITNFYEENQENDWQTREWVKLNFAKNDLSDLAPFFADLNPILQRCVNESESSATLTPGSFQVDTAHGYMEFGLTLTLPIAYGEQDAAQCIQAFGPAAQTSAALGRSTVTMNILYSFVRPDALPNDILDGTYLPMPIAEKDPIHHKYGAFEAVPLYRDLTSGLLGAKQLVMRFDPNRDITFYFAPGVPASYQAFFTGPSGVVAQTNAVLAAAHAKGKLVVLNYDDDKVLNDHKAATPRHVGDIRYSFIIVHSDLDNGSGLLGIAQFSPDLRTGQLISATVNLFEGPFKDSVQQRLDLFLTSAGAEYLLPGGEFNDAMYPPSCAQGQNIPLVDAKVAGEVNAKSTVYGKMQAYLQRPVSQFGNLGPSDFLPTHDSDFYDAYFALLPYQVYADPAANPFVTPEGSTFQSSAQENWAALKQLAAYDQLTASLDHGEAPFDIGAADGVPQAIAFNRAFSQLTQAVADYPHIKARRPLSSHADDINLFSYIDVYKKNGRHCVGGRWETRAEYTGRLLTSLNNAVILHEFGHTLGLRHNFMGSVDQRNFAKNAAGEVTLYASSIMDYNQALVEAFYTTAAPAAGGGPGGGWPPYDAAALAWIYGNDQDRAHLGPVPTSTGAALGISGQVSPTAPWNDPLGFNPDGSERPFLYCTDEHIAYTPLCRQYDMGSTPSEIIANEIQQREWNYLWTNFRLYHKFFDLSKYGQTVARNFTEYRRFLSLWTYDWSPGELTNTLRLIGVKVPDGATAGDYYSQLTNKFNHDISLANQLSAAYHRAIIDQASGERPFKTVFDPFYGDTTQQGIQLDKLTAIDSFSNLWPAISNFDPSQAGEFMLSSAVGEDGAYNSVAQSVLLDFLGANFATYTYAQIGPLAAFAQETHSTMWPGPDNMRAWMGGLAFERERDFLDYVRGIAVQYAFSNCDENGVNCDPCTSLDHCSWDPRPLQTKPSQATQSDRYNRFQAPDGRTYIWMYIASRNQWVLADKDRNVAMYTLILNWSTDVVNGEDDGYQGAQGLETKVRFAIDAFRYFDANQTTTQ